MRRAAEREITRLSADDRRLIVQARAGDDDAFRQLVERYQRKAYSVAYGMLHDRDDAMDVVQEAFVKVHKYLDRFEGTSGFYTWLYRIVVNACIDHLRKAGKARAVEYDDTRAADAGTTDELLPSTFEADPDRSLARKEIREKVDVALQRLSPIHRAVILMREIEGLSYAEMAAAMECSMGTIMSRLFHARRRMQAALIELLELQPFDNRGEGTG